jgi:dethiobiotin synthase
MTRRAGQGFFITGTGTGVGKTFVCRVLAQALSSRCPVSYLKPVQTGCLQKKSGRIVSPDFEYVKECGSLTVGEDNLHVPYKFIPECSPHCAARMSHEEISLKKISDSLTAVKGLFGKSRGCVLVEGAGGVLVPLGDSISMVHLIERLRLPVILVTTPVLGTLNQTFLTLCALQSIGADIAGLVMNCPWKIARDYIYKDNLETVRAFIRPVPFLEMNFRHARNKATMEFCNELVQRYL